MLSSKGPPRPPGGMAMGSRQKRTLDLLAQLTRVEGGRGTMWTPIGPLLAPPGGLPLRFGQTSGGGITARSGTTMGTGTVKDASANSSGTIAVGSTTFTAWNFSTTAIGASAAKYVVCAQLWGLWVVISAEC